MADRIAEPDDVAVDELKRKARRRLVGAIVLALAAAIVVPMLLEREPRPLGDEVSVQIPPVDDGKFVNRLTPKGESTAPKGDAKAKADPSSGTSGAAHKSISDVEQRVLAAPPPVAPAPAIPADEKAASSAGSKTQGAPLAPPSSVVSTLPGSAETSKTETAKGAAEPAKAAPPKSIAVPKSEPAKSVAAPKAEPEKVAAAPTKPEPKTSGPAAKSDASHAEPASIVGSAAPSASTGGATKGDSFVVQLAAFADDKGANALTGKLKRAGYPAFTEPVQTSQGTLWRVRVGGYPTREAASDARGKLKADGYTGIVAATR